MKSDIHVSKKWYTGKHWCLDLHVCERTLKCYRSNITGPMVNHTKRDGFVVNSGCRFYKYDLLARIKEQLIDCVI